MIKNNEAPRTVADIYSGEQAQTPGERARNMQGYFLDRGLANLAMGVKNTNDAHEDGAFTDAQAHSALNYYGAIQASDKATLAGYPANSSPVELVEQAVPTTPEKVVLPLPDLPLAV